MKTLRVLQFRYFLDAWLAGKNYYPEAKIIRVGYGKWELCFLKITKKQGKAQLAIFKS